MIRNSIAGSPQFRKSTFLKCPRQLELAIFFPCDFFFAYLIRRSNKGKKFYQTRFPARRGNCVAGIPRNSLVALRRMCNDLADVIFIRGSRE